MLVDFIILGLILPFTFCLNFRVKLPTSEFIQREAPAMATHGLGLGQEAVTLHTKAGVPHTTSLPSGPTETGDGNFFLYFFRRTELLCAQNLHSRLMI